MWAKNNCPSGHGSIQARDIFNSAVKGLCRGRNGEQSFDHQVASKLHKHNAQVLNIVPKSDSFDIPPKALVLSKYDRDFRRQAQRLVDYSDSLQNYYNSLSNDDKFKEAAKELLSYNKFFKHHMDERENNNTLNNLLLIPYDDSTLELAHTAHTLIHSVKDTVGNIHFGKNSIQVYDLRNKRKFTVEIIVKP